MSARNKEIFKNNIEANTPFTVNTQRNVQCKAVVNYLLSLSIISPRSLMPKVNQRIIMNKMIFTRKGIAIPNSFWKKLAAGGK
jgi:hypothetical protein